MSEAKGGRINLTKEQLLKKIDNLDKKRPLRLLVTVVELPTGALETEVNNQFLVEKIRYILDTYDDDLKLKLCNNIRLLDCIIL